MISGFDVSGNSGTINFAAAKAAGHAFCFMRVGRGIASSATDAQGLDTRWQTYRTQAAAAGLLYGGYWRFYVNVDVNVQVARFATALKQSPGMLSPLVDIEDAGGLPPAALTDWSINCLRAVHKATGRRPILYTGGNFLKTSLQEWRLDEWGRCVANWSATAWPDHSAVFWQSKGDVPATWAQGNVDLQKFACRAVDLLAHTREHELVYWVDDDGQLYGPRVLWTPLPEGQDERQRATPRRIVLHTMAGWLIRTDEMFRSAAVGVESTFGTGHTVDATQFKDPALDGQIRQWVECDVIANANLEGDRGVPDIVSFESADGGVQRALSPKQAFTTWQAMAAVCWRYGIATVELPDSCEGRSGIGWHRLGVPGNWPAPPSRYRGKKSTCEAWSGSPGKECPWPMRIDQIVITGIPTIKRIVTGVRTVTLQGDGFDMADVNDLRAIFGLKPGQNFALAVFGQGDNAQVFGRTVNVNDASSLAARLGRVEVALTAIAAKQGTGLDELTILHALVTAVQSDTTLDSERSAKILELVEEIEAALPKPPPVPEV